MDEGLLGNLSPIPSILEVICGLLAARQVDENSCQDYTVKTLGTNRTHYDLQLVRHYSRRFREKEIQLYSYY